MNTEYCELTHRKDYGISPLLERRRRSITHPAHAPTPAASSCGGGGGDGPSHHHLNAKRKIVFSSDVSSASSSSCNPKEGTPLLLSSSSSSTFSISSSNLLGGEAASPPREHQQAPVTSSTLVPDDDDIQVLEPCNDSLEVLYDAKRVSIATSSATGLDCSGGLIVESQDISLLLSQDTQQQTPNLCLLPKGFTASQDTYYNDSKSSSSKTVVAKAPPVFSDGEDEIDDVNDAPPSSRSLLVCYDTLESSSNGDSLSHKSSVGKNPTLLASKEAASGGKYVQQLTPPSVRREQSPLTVRDSQQQQAPEGLATAMSEEPSQYPVCTLNPSQVRVLLSGEEEPRHSQSPDIAPLLSDDLRALPAADACPSKVVVPASVSPLLTPLEVVSAPEELTTKTIQCSVEMSSTVVSSLLKSEVTKDASLQDDSQDVCIIGESERPCISKKLRSPSKYKDDCHQSLVVVDPAQSSSESSTCSSNGVQILHSARHLSGTDSKVSGESQVEEAPQKIKLPEISISQTNHSPTPPPCIGTLVAKASKAARENILQLEKKLCEDKRREEQRQRLLLQSDSFYSETMDTQPSASVALQQTSELMETKPAPPLQDHVKDASIKIKHRNKPGFKQKHVSDESDKDGTTLPVPLQESVEEINGECGNDNKNVTPKSELLRPSLGETRRTSTPNLAHLSQGVSPNISGEGGSYIEKEEAVTSVEVIREAPLSENDSIGAVATIERNDSTKTTIEIEESVEAELTSMMSIDEIRAKGGVPGEVLHLKFTAWRLPFKDKPIYVCDRGDEELILTELPFKKKLVKSGSSTTSASSTDRRVSDVSTLTSSSSAYHADKSSSSSSSSRRTSTMSMIECAAKNRLSIDSVQILPGQTSHTLSAGNKQLSPNKQRDLFAKPSSRRLLKSIPRRIVEETSSSDDRESLLRSKAESLKAIKAKQSSVKQALKEIIYEETDPDKAAIEGIDDAEVVDLTMNEPFSRMEEGTHLSRLKAGVINKGLHYELDKFMGDLPSSILNILKSVQLSEEEEDLFLADHSDTNLLDINEEQTSMVVSRMIHSKLTPKTLVFAKYFDHFYSAVLDSENPIGGWDLTYTLDGFQKYCPIEHILPIDILPRGQTCFRRYQGAGNTKSIVSVRVVILGHTVEGSTVLHIADDSHKAFRVPHCHLSMQLGDADRYLKAWRASQSIISSGPELLLDNIIEGKRRRGQILSSPSNNASKTRAIRKKPKKKPDPNLDTSLTETDLTLENDEFLSGAESSDGGCQRQTKKRKVSPSKALSSPATSSSKASPSVSLHPRVLELIQEKVTDDDPSDDESYTPNSRANKKKTPRRKTPQQSRHKRSSSSTTPVKRSSKRLQPPPHGVTAEGKEPSTGSEVAYGEGTPHITAAGDGEENTTPPPPVSGDTNTPRRSKTDAGEPMSSSDTEEGGSIVATVGRSGKKKRGGVKRAGNTPKQGILDTDEALEASADAGEYSSTPQLTPSNAPRKRGRPPGALFHLL